MLNQPDKICVRIHATRGLSAKIVAGLGHASFRRLSMEASTGGESATGGGHHGADARANQA